ncbi:F-box/LRR-repeat protein At3g03360-like [Salvia hispanica]|uniref:F-box/LRR-repeat protein At3g03360-like n=1 Tax=Salvia hispanica TaxID=49212 RepID=UPI0020093E5F|nr:F-box/LRR-repeat protein At3g03360-like [Salvia hispanica]
MKRTPLKLNKKGQEYMGAELSRQTLSPLYSNELSPGIRTREGLLGNHGDRISMLPDDVLVLILSSLSLKEATATSILSSRWKNLWNLTPKLDLDLDWTAILNKRRNYDMNNMNNLSCEYVRWVDRLLTTLPKSSTTNLVRFRVLFELTSFFTVYIDDWVSYAVSRKVEHLELILDACLPREYYSFPYKKGNFPENLRWLKKLSLHCVNVSGETVEFLLRKCRLLEQLSLSQCGKGLSSLEIVRTSPVFKCLEISQCYSLNSVVVRESKVVCIKYAGVGEPRCRFKLVDVPLFSQLWIQAEAYTRLSYIINITDIINMFDDVLPQLHMLKIYTKSKISLYDNLHKMMPNLKELVVVVGSDYGDKYSLVPIIRWFSVAPCLQRFVLEAPHQEKIKEEKKVSRAPKVFSIDCLLNGSDLEVWDINRRNEVQRAYSHIKEVKFVGYRGVYNHIQMISLLAHQGSALEKIIVDTRSFELHENMPWDRISRNQNEDEIIARKRAKSELKHVTSGINVSIL